MNVNYSKGIQLLGFDYRKLSENKIEFTYYWKKTGIVCSAENNNNELPSNQSIPEDQNAGLSRGKECNVKEDCNGEDYICSNGDCLMFSSLD